MHRTRDPLANKKTACCGSDSVMAQLKNYSFRCSVSQFLMFVSRPTGVQLIVFLCFSIPVVLFDTPMDLQMSQHVVSVESSSLLH